MIQYNNKVNVVNSCDGTLTAPSASAKHCRQRPEGSLPPGVLIFNEYIWWRNQRRFFSRGLVCIAQVKWPYKWAVAQQRACWWLRTLYHLPLSCAKRCVCKAISTHCETMRSISSSGQHCKITLRMPGAIARRNNRQSQQHTTTKRQQPALLTLCAKRCKTTQPWTLQRCSGM